MIEKAIGAQFFDWKCF